MSSVVETLQEGLEHHRAGRLIEAELLYRRALKLHPRSAPAVHLLGLIAFQVGKPETAAEYLNEAIRLDGFHAPFSADLGEVYRALGKIPEAIAAYRKALELDPEMADGHNNLGTLLQSQGEWSEARACFQEALQLNAAHAEAHCNLGVNLQHEGQLTEAQAAYGRSAQLAPDSAETYFRLGTCLRDQGNLLDAIACFHKAVRLNPEHAQAQHELALTRLTQGDYATGWRDVTWGLRVADCARRSYLLPVWSGGDLHGKAILLHAQQSLADTLLLLRYVALIESRRGRVVLDVPEPLVKLLTCAGYSQVVPDGELPPACEAQAAFSSLPAIFGTRLESIPRGPAYLKPDAELSAAWRERLQSLPGFKVGIAWRGNRAERCDGLRSIPLDQLEALARVPGVTLVSLQGAQGRAEQAALADRWTLADWSDQLDDPVQGQFANLAALMSNLDLVISCDAPSAHLAGALGVPVWVALSTAATWPWMQDHADCAWYPSARLFRRGADETWHGVVERMAGELTTLAART